MLSLDDEHGERRVEDEVLDDLVALHLRVLYYLGRKEFQEAFNAQRAVSRRRSSGTRVCGLVAAVLPPRDPVRGEGHQLVHADPVRALSGSARGRLHGERARNLP